MEGDVTSWNPEAVRSILSLLAPHVKDLQRVHGVLTLTLSMIEINTEPRLVRLKYHLEALTSHVEAIVTEVAFVTPRDDSGAGVKAEPIDDAGDQADNSPSAYATQRDVSLTKNSGNTSESSHLMIGQDSPSTEKTKTQKMVRVKLVGKKERKKRIFRQSQECELCGEMFNDRRRHMNSAHPGERMFRCLICSLEFDNLIDLRKHKSLHKSTGFCCDLCGEVFSWKETLKSHLVQHVKGEYYPKRSIAVGTRSSHVCHLCGQSFPTYKSRLLHLRRECKGIKKVPAFSCSSCRRRFHTKEELELHRKKHNLTCEFCGQKFSTRSKLCSHYKSHRVKESHPCSYCRNVFKSAAALNMHMNIHLGKRPFKCTHCDEYFPSPSARKNHVRRKHNMSYVYKCEICSKGFFYNKVRETHYLKDHSQEELTAHSITFEMFHCEICGELLRKSQYRNHMKKAHVNKLDMPFECEVCHLKFDSGSSLRKHSQIHNVDSELKGGDNVCNICGDAYKTPAALRIHQVQKHYGMKKPLYKCDLCQKEFFAKFYFTKHKCTSSTKQSGEQNIVKLKEHVCDICGKSYERYAVFLKHKKSHEGVPIMAQIIHTCHVCNKDFPTENNLKEHMTTEHLGVKPYKCSTCGKEVATYMSLTRHEKLHLGEKLFPCDFCGKQFSQKSNMITHRRKHTGEKPFQCDICGMRFSDPSTAYKHKAVHKKEQTVMAHTSSSSFPSSANPAAIELSFFASLP